MPPVTVPVFYFSNLQKIYSLAVIGFYVWIMHIFGEFIICLLTLTEVQYIQLKMYMFFLYSLLNESLPVWNQCSFVTPSPLFAAIGSIFRFQSHFQSPTSAHWLIFSLALTQVLAGGDWLLHILLSVPYQDTKSYPFISSQSHSISDVCAAL